MKCTEEIWGLTQLYLEQNLAIKILLHHPSEKCFLLKMPSLPSIEPETAACKVVTLPLRLKGRVLVYVKPRKKQLCNYHPLSCFKIPKEITILLT